MLGHGYYSNRFIRNWDDFHSNEPIFALPLPYTSCAGFSKQVIFECTTLRRRKRPSFFDAQPSKVKILYGILTNRPSGVKIPHRILTNRLSGVKIPHRILTNRPRASRIPHRSFTVISIKVYPFRYAKHYILLFYCDFAT